MRAEPIIVVDVYFDYLCPFVYNASLWLERVKESLGSTLVINWSYFSLEQVNSKQGAGWKLWEQPDDYPSRGLRAFRAAEAARRQGEAAFKHFHRALLRARHEQDRDIADVNTLIQVAQLADLDLTRFSQDLTDPATLTRLAEDHTFAAEKLGVFGTPTLVFPGKQAVFLKMPQPPPPEECAPVFGELYQLATRRTYIQEVKKPQPVTPQNSSRR